MSRSKATLVILLALIGTSWLQDASVRAAPYLGDFDVSRWHENFTSRLDDALKTSLTHFDGTLDSKDPQKPREGERNYFGSQTFQRNNVYPADGMNDALYGSLDVQIGNSYSGNSNGRNVYGPILVQENNTYGGQNKNAQHGATVVRAGNSYPHNPGKNDIFNPIVIQSNNTYLNNVKNNTKHGADVKPRGHNKPPSKHHHDSTGAHVGLGMEIKEHEEMSNIIHNYLNTEQLPSKQCANGMMNLERLDEINSLYLEVNSQVAQLKALKGMNSSRKIICDTILNLCSKHDRVGKWIARARHTLMTNANRSRTRWESLRVC